MKGSDESEARMNTTGNSFNLISRSRSMMAQAKLKHVPFERIVHDQFSRVFKDLKVRRAERMLTESVEEEGGKEWNRDEMRYNNARVK